MQFLRLIFQTHVSPMQVYCTLQAVPSTKALALDLPAEAMRMQFLRLITCMPGLVESYETVDCSGATVRR